MARVGLEVDADRLAARAAGRGPAAPWWYLTSPVPPCGIVVTASSVEAPSNSAKIVLVGAAEVVGEHVQPAAVGHPDDDLLGAAGRRQLDQLVEHRHRHVEALDRELVLAEVGLVHEALERVDLDQARQQSALLVALERLCGTLRSRSSRAASALAVGGDVLDLVGDRAAVGVAQVRAALPRASLRGRRCAAACAGIWAISSASARAPAGRAPGRPRGSSRAGRGAPRGGRGCARGCTSVFAACDGLQQLLAACGRRSGRARGAAGAAVARGAARCPSCHAERCEDAS